MAGRVLAAVLCVTLAGCATRLPTVERGAEIAIVVDPDPAPAIEVSAKQIVAQDAGVGSSIGYAGGALWGLACGPFAPLCVPVFAVLGGAAGGLTGALVGAMEASPDETRRQLDARVHAFAERHNASDCVLDAVRSRVAARFKLVNEGSDPAMTVLTIRVSEAAVYAYRDHQAQLVIRANVTPTSVGQQPRKLAPVATPFIYAGPITDARMWIDDENGFIRRSLEQACQWIADEVVAGLSE